MNHKRDIDIPDELEIIYNNAIIKDFQKKWLEYLERRPENRIPKLMLYYKLKGGIWRERTEKRRKIFNLCNRNQ
jgi:hypothetical protein